MKNYLNNKGMFILHYRLLVLSSMLLAFCLFFCWILFPDKASSGPYLDSAHGNTTYGVNRSGLLTLGYSKGNCAHCHEQHASIGGDEPDPIDRSPSRYELFRQLFADQGDSFCYSCHKQLVGSIQISMPNQYNYSRIAGGDTTITCPDDLKGSFQFVDTSGNHQMNCNSNNGSSHFLQDIKTFLTSRWEYGEKTNPCSGCHNPHRAQGDPLGSGSATKSPSTRGWPISRPSQHKADNNEWGLWGDNISDDPPYTSINERMNKYTYQAPCRYPWSNPCTSYEPDGSATTDGSNVTDSITFCLDCHQYSIQGTVRNIRPINWYPNGDIHGAASQYCSCDYADKKAPYTNVPSNYVLSCLDCHEPHGSPNEFLLRQEVNGTNNLIFGTHKYFYFCFSCHKDRKKHTVQEIGSKDDCWGCHSHGATYPSDDLNRCTGCPAYIKTF